MPMNTMKYSLFLTTCCLTASCISASSFLASIVRNVNEASSASGCPCAMENSWCLYGNATAPCPRAGTCKGSTTPCDCDSCPTTGYMCTGCDGPSPGPAQCTNSPVDWKDANGNDCAIYKQYNYCGSYGNTVGTDGFTANQACCACGGGNTASPTPSPDPIPTPSPGCTNTPSNWIADNYFTCDNIKLYSWCAQYGGEIGTDGKTANEACCTCGGGNTASPTPSPDPA